jgi:hypothetical protein
MFDVLITLLLLTLPAAVQAQFNYTTISGTITITGYTGPGGAVTIPDTINGLPVESIGDWAFSECISLTSVAIPDSVTTIGIEAFWGCTSLTSVMIGNSVTSIEGGAFWRCASLTAITVDTNNPFYSTVDGVLFNKSQNTLIQCPPGKAGSYTVPNSVTGIGGFAFIYCTSLTSLTIGNSVVSIGEEAGWGTGTFSGCTSLTNVMIGDSVTNIGYGAFSKCTSLTSVTIGDSVASIGQVAFWGCTSLASVTIPNSVTSIVGWAFWYCTSLTNITIPSSVTTIGSGAFSECTNLTAFTLDALNPAYSSVDGVLFNESQTTLVEYPGGKDGSYTVPNSVASIGESVFASCASLPSITIPNSVTNIGGVAFYNCTSLASVMIGNSVVSIGYEAFRGCTSLTSVTIPNSVLSIESYAFEECANLTSVYFKGDAPSVGLIVFSGSDAATVYYLPGTTGWGATFAERPTALWVLPYPVILTTTPSFGIQTDGFGFTISWATNIPVVVEASTSLANPSWFPVSTNTLTDGWAYFSDPDWKNYSSRFYRVRSQ